MSLKNNDFRNKLKAAFKDAGIEIPRSVKPPKNLRAKKQKKSAKQRPSANAILNKDNNKQGQTVPDKHGYKAKKSGGQRFGSKSIKDLSDNLPSSEAARAAYGSYKKNHSVKQTETIIRPRNTHSFQPNPDFRHSLNRRGSPVIVNEPTCITQLSSDPSVELQLIVGLDLGTSTSKVVIGDPANKKFYAVPFSAESDNPYLLPTSISILEDGDVIITDNIDTEPRRDIKLTLMHDDSHQSMIAVAAYVAQVIRYSLNWFFFEHADAYCDAEVVWTMAVGLPADAVRQNDIERRFRLSAITGAQVAITSGAVCQKRVSSLLRQVSHDYENHLSTGEDSRFKEFGSDPEIVSVVPEIAAQMIGLYKSRRWDTKRPISFLLDIGAGTVDAAVFSLVDPTVDDKDLMFCGFSCDVSELGVRRLHLDRVKWLNDNLPQGLVGRDQIKTYLNHLKSLDQSNSPVPLDIADYVNSIEIVNGETNRDPDREYRLQLSKSVRDRVLCSAKRKSEADSAWSGLRTLVCGGGARSDFYADFIRRLAGNSGVGIKLEIEELDKPDNLIAPGLPESEYDRLSVAYGLAQGEQWQESWLREADDIPRVRRGSSEAISKDLV